MHSSETGGYSAFSLCSLLAAVNSRQENKPVWQANDRRGELFPQLIYTTGYLKGLTIMMRRGNILEKFLSVIGRSHSTFTNGGKEL